MEQRKHHDEMIAKDFEQALEELIAVLAEICVHEFLNQKLKDENDDNKSKTDD